jgi:hypothetical protein
MERVLMIGDRKGTGLKTTRQALEADHDEPGPARSAPAEAALHWLAVVDQPSAHDSGDVFDWRGQRAPC